VCERERVSVRRREKVCVRGVRTVYNFTMRVLGWQVVGKLILGGQRLIHAVR
jgi:hypothetical protein